MSRLIWDEVSKKEYQTGVDQGVLFTMKDDGTYNKGVAWSGLTAVNASPSGAEVTKLYADNDVYAELVSTEQLGGTIEAYMSPEEFDECDGEKQLAPGVTIGQQSRKKFGFAYRTLRGNDVLGTDYGYVIHLWYGCLAQPSEKSNSTVNESPEANTLSWTISASKVPVNTVIDGKKLKPTASVDIDSTTVEPAKLALIEDLIFGKENGDPTLPTPDEIYAILTNP